MTERYRRCANCEYFQPDSGTEYPECHRRAPYSRRDHGHPAVKPTGWCGDWIPKDYNNNPAIKAAWDEFVTLHILARNHD